MKLGNGVGTVYKLSGKRRNPYIVRKTVGWEIDVETGKCKQVCVTIGYAPTRAKGLEMLMEYNKNPYDIAVSKITFSEVFDKWASEKFPTIDLALEYAANYPALVYYDSKVKHPVVNTMAEKALAYQIAFLRGLRKDPEKPHAFAQAILELYGKKPVISDDMFLYYNRILDFKTKAAEAFDTYKNSEKNAECLDRLKAELKVACNSTKVYNDGKQLTSNIQISTVNDILKAAGIAYEIKAKVEVFNIASV